MVYDAIGVVTFGGAAMSVLNKTKSSAKSDRFKRHNKAQDEEDEMLIFGYSCKLYRDDEKALQEDEGTLLIPWMGEKSLMVDRLGTP